MNDRHELDGHEVPGPGHYDTTKMKPNARSAPSITIGVRYAVKEQVSENPGPYVNMSIVLQNRTITSRKPIVLHIRTHTLIDINTHIQILTLLTREPLRRQHYVVADGKKTAELLSTKHACDNTIFGKSKRWPKPTAASDVGPGKYQSNHTSFGKQVSSKLGTSSAIKFGTGPQRQIGKLDDCSVPYIAAPSMIGKGPKISMHFREKFGSTTFTKGNNPGPGAYTPEDQPGRAGTAKVRGFGFGSAARLPKEKHSENPGPGTFFLFSQKQKKM